MPALRPYGITVPFERASLLDQRAWVEEAAELGYTDLWSYESGALDGFTPLALASVWAPGVRLGTAIVSTFSRGPAVLAMHAAALAEAAPGRFALGIGSSSNVIVEAWNGIPFDRPYQRVRDMLRFLRTALSGEKVTCDYETFSVRGFRLARPLPEGGVPPLLVGALRPGMLRLAGKEGDGAIVNWLSAGDVKTVVGHVGEGKEVVARIFVCPSPDAAAVRARGKQLLAAYLNVPVYAEFHRFLGRQPLLGPMWEAWAAGDRRAAVASIPDEVVDELLVHGSPASCKEQVARYVEAGVTTPVLNILPMAGVDERQAMRDLAPTR